MGIVVVSFKSRRIYLQSRIGHRLSYAVHNAVLVFDVVDANQCSLADSDSACLQCPNFRNAPTVLPCQSVMLMLKNHQSRSFSRNSRSRTPSMLLRPRRCPFEVDFSLARSSSLVAMPKRMRLQQLMQGRSKRSSPRRPTRPRSTPTKMIGQVMWTSILRRPDSHCPSVSQPSGLVHSFMSYHLARPEVRSLVVINVYEFVLWTHMNSHSSRSCPLDCNDICALIASAHQLGSG